MSESRKYGFGSENFDWNKYQLYRPKYPESVFKRIFEYHDERTNQRSTALDIGTGYGIVASRLAKYFDHVYVSDPSSYNLQVAQKHLKSLGDEEGKYTFAQFGAEDVSVAEENIDLVTIFMAMHWTTSVNEAIESVAKSLKPNGTLALLYYCPRPHFINNPRAEAAAENIFGAFDLHVNKAKTSAFDIALSQGNAGLDFVPLPSNLFQDGALRIYINTEGGGDFPFMKSSAWPYRAPSNLGPMDRIEKVQDNGWSQVIDGEWYSGLMNSLQQGLDLDPLQNDFDELRRAISDKGGATEILWRVNLVLATKK